MFTMTVMQHERETVRPFSTETAEAQDVLSRLRHLHHTLQECHRRVQRVDHTLWTQGHHGQQNQTEKESSFENKAKKDCSPQSEAKKNHNLEFEFEKDSSPPSRPEKDLDLEEQFREPINYQEQVEDGGVLNLPCGNPNWLNGHGKESENHSREDNPLKPIEERHSIVDTDNGHQKLSIQADGSFQDLYNDTKGNLEYTKHTETKEENKIQESNKDPCCLRDTDSSEKRQKKYLIRQENTDLDDPLPVDSCSPITWPSLHSSDHDADGISSASETIAYSSDQTHQFNSVNRKLSENMLKQESLLNQHHTGEVRYRPGSIQDRENKICHEGDMNFHKKQMKDNMLEGHHEKSKEVGCAKYVGKLPSVVHPPEAAQRKTVIWETLENYQSHFPASHSPLVDCSDISYPQEFTASPDNSYEDKSNSDQVPKCAVLHAMGEELTSETTQLHQTLCEPSSQRKLPARRHPHCVCQDPNNQISSHRPLKGTANSAAVSDSSVQGRTYMRVLKDTCPWIAVTVLLVLLSLFIASCLLLVLTVVSVSVRTTGGLPAF